jgi:hypothetical protein
MRSHVLLDVHFAEEGSIANVTRISEISLVSCAAMFDEKRPLRKRQLAVWTGLAVSWKMSRE